jgi:threonine dehydrogenase-like Zn-dependent dehydrogenase
VHVDVNGPIALIGAGTLGLLTLAALAHHGRDDVVVAARYGHQQRLAKELGASRVVDPGELAGAIRLATGSMVLGSHDGGQLTGGAPVVIDCVGSDTSLAQALQVVAPGGTVLVVGMPATVRLDLTGLWHREVALRGVYAYDHHDFRTAIDLVANADLGRLVSRTYRLDRYADAITHAADAGRRGAVKIAVDLRSPEERKH